MIQVTFLIPEELDNQINLLKASTGRTRRELARHAFELALVQCSFPPLNKGHRLDSPPDLRDRLIDAREKILNNVQKTAGFFERHFYGKFLTDHIDRYASHAQELRKASERSQG